MDALHGLQLVVQDVGTDVVSGKEEAEVARLRQVQMGHDISFSRWGWDGGITHDESS